MSKKFNLPPIVQSIKILFSSIWILYWSTRADIHPCHHNYNLLSLYLPGKNKNLLTYSEYVKSQSMNSIQKVFFFFVYMFLLVILTDLLLAFSLNSFSKFLVLYHIPYICFVIIFGWFYSNALFLFVWAYLWGFKTEDFASDEESYDKIVQHYKHVLGLYGKDSPEAIKLAKVHDTLSKTLLLQHNLSLDESLWKVMYGIMRNEPCYNGYVLRIKSKW
jgi:hypothetical protein